MPEGIIHNPSEQNLGDESFTFAQDIVLEAGELIRSGIAAGFETEWKADNTPVTSVDKAINKFVAEKILAKYPNDIVIGEEGRLGGGDGLTWILDPIDGTQTMDIENINTATCCLARLDQNGQPIFGIVYNPAATAELFVAKSGEASMRNGEPIRVSDRTELKGSYCYLGSRMPETAASNGVIVGRLESAGAKWFNARSLAFGCCEVAKGNAVGAYIGVKTPFEAASVKLIVEGAGGKVTDLYGDPIDRVDGEIKGLIATNGHLHQNFVEAARK